MFMQHTQKKRTLVFRTNPITSYNILKIRHNTILRHHPEIKIQDFMVVLRNTI